MKRVFPLLAALLCLTATSISTAQRGPGGVTDDLNNQKNCRVWLDAGDLTGLADGDPVDVWFDKSISDVQDSAFWDENDAALYLQPLFRDAPAASINGKPVVSFESGGMLTVGKWPGQAASTDLNSNPNVLTTYEQTMFFAFRTAADVSSRQIIWEEGGSNRGFKIFINNDFVHIAAYDDIFDSGGSGDPGSGTVPKFGFSYKRMPIQSNTTYVLSFVYDVPTDNTLLTSTSPTYAGLTGSLNGQEFPNTLLHGCCENPGVGGVFTHPDPIGIGGLKRTSYDESGRLNTSHNGTRLFQGRLAEICYYAYAMNQTERIIVENYLAAKYFANVIANDKFEHEAEYGDGVIGIGRESGTDFHNISQGDNLFEISAPDINDAFGNSVGYLMVGHNNSNISWTAQNTPDENSIQRLRRVWRWDRNAGGSVEKNTTIKLHPEDIAKLPPLPPGFTKYGILMESVSNNSPNFNSSNSEIIELVNDGSGTYSKSVDIEDNAFFTLCAIKPTVEFELFTDYTIEGDPTPAATPAVANIKLNYQPDPSTSFTAGYFFDDITAFNGTDYNGSTGSYTFSGGNVNGFVPFSTVNDVLVGASPIKEFQIILDPSTSSPDISIGAKDTLIYSIYDNDPDPKITFTSSSSNVSETAGSAEVTVQVLGTTTGSSTVRIRRPNTAVSGTATYLDDYTLPVTDGWVNASGGSRRKTVTIPAGTNESVTVNIPIIADDIDENDETIVLELTPAGGEAGTGDGSVLEHTITILDQNPEPTVRFISAASEGYRSISDPRIYLELSSASEKEIEVPFSIVGGSAVNDNIAPGGDYSANPAGGMVIFPPGVTEQFLFYNSSTGNANIIVYSNESVEEDRTILFELDDAPVNAGLGSIENHTYTIKAYTEFEWQGVAGVGKRNDNTFWIVPDEAASGASGNIPNLSPRPVQILQDASSRRPVVTEPGIGVNNHKMLRFDGNDDFLKVGGSGNMEGQFNLINSGGQYDYKSIFLAFRPHNVSSSTPQVIYEQGGGDRGISLYIQNSKLYFAAWNRRNDGNHSPWGQSSYLSGNITAYVESTTLLQNNETYIVSCHMGRNWSTDASEDFEAPEISGLRMYINGDLEDTFDGNIGRLYTHSGRTALGAAWHQTRYANSQTIPASSTTQSADYYDGDIGEVIYLNEPKMNETRIRILHNYFSSLYNIPLSTASQVFDLNYANNVSIADPAYNRDVAGIGKIGNTVHGDSKGLSQMRVRDPNFTESTAFLMWGHNGESMTDTWPFSNSALPGNVIERSGRVWRFHTNPVGGIASAQILMSFDEAEFASQYSSNPDHLKLLIHNNSDPDDFSTAQVIEVSQILSGNVAQFSEVPISEGSYMALGNTTSIFPLPIELLNFNARNNGPVVDIYWSTASEVNNDYFVVERAGGDLIWEEVAQTPGAGNSTSTLSYIEKDRDPLPGVSYYRLKQVDFDGTSTLSDVVSVSRTETSNEPDVFLYPNPNQSHSTFVRISKLDYDEMVNIRVLDMSGKIVRSEKLDHNGGIFEVFHGKLQPGIYLVQVESENCNETRKLVITD